MKRESEDRGFSSTILLIYAVAVSLLAFALRDPIQMILPFIINFLPGLYLGLKRYRLLILLLLLGVVGLFMNALLVSNTGGIIFAWGFLVVREGAVRASLDIFLRLGMITGGTLLFVSLTDPRRVIRDLERDLRLPSGIIFALFYALRLYPLLSRDLEEIRMCLLQRSKKIRFLTPGELQAILYPLLSIGIERAVWAGISAEMRGLSLRRPVEKRLRFGVRDLLVVLLLIAQYIYSIILSQRIFT
mgnify:CR=1 FL=1